MKLCSSTRFEKFLDLPLELRCLVYHHYASIIPQAPVYSIDEDLRPDGFVQWRRSEKRKRATRPPPLMLANKQISLEYQDQIKRMPHRSLFVHITNVSIAESKSAMQKFELPAQDFRVATVYATFDNIPREAQGNVKAIKAHVLHQLERVKGILELCDGVKKLHCYFRQMMRLSWSRLLQLIRELKMSFNAGIAPQKAAWETYAGGGYYLYQLTWILGDASANVRDGGLKLSITHENEHG